MLKLVGCPEFAKLADSVAAQLDKLLSEKLKPGDIGIVSLRGQTAAGTVDHRDRIGRQAFV